MPPGPKLGRRGALLGIGASAVVLPSLVRAETRPVSPPSTARRTQPAASAPDAALAHGLAPADDEVRALLGPLVEGATVDRWRIEAIHALRLGAIPLVLSGPDGSFAVEIVRRDPALRAPAEVGPLSILVQNRGRGAHATAEEQGLGAMALARVLGARLAQGASVPAGLRTQPERSALHPDAVLHVPV